MQTDPTYLNNFSEITQFFRKGRKIITGKQQGKLYILYMAPSALQINTSSYVILYSFFIRFF